MHTGDRHGTIQRYVPLERYARTLSTLNHVAAKSHPGIVYQIVQPYVWAVYSEAPPISRLNYKPSAHRIFKSLKPV